MTTPDERAEAMKLVALRTEQLERVQELASAAIAAAGKDRARAVKHAVSVTSVKEVAGELGVSVQRIYTLIREADQA